jgi:threonine synthase
MGVPIGRLLCATNKNDIVHRTLSRGDMTLGENVPTLSPAMDIQFAYNLERLLYFVSGGDVALVKSFMIPLDQQLNHFESDFATSPKLLPDEILSKIHETFMSYSVSDEETLQIISEVWTKYHYPLCPHSATGVHAAIKIFPDWWSVHRNDSGGTPLICVLTAHPSKFPNVFLQATGEESPELFCHPVKRLAELPTRYDWLKQYDDQKVIRPNWRNEWIVEIKRKLNEIST